MKRRGLRTAIAKLEAKRRNRRAVRPIIFTMYPGEDGGGEIIALASGRDTVARLWQDSDLGAFARRAASALGGARILIARHRPAESPEASLEEPVAPPVAPTVQDEPARVSDFYQTAWLRGQS